MTRSRYVVKVCCLYFARWGVTTGRWNHPLFTFERSRAHVFSCDGKIAASRVAKALGKNARVVRLSPVPEAACPFGHHDS